jgi:integrating conjugative element membrane protein (TIGR03745 family)
VLTVGLVFASPLALADLPQPVDPTVGGADTSDYLGMIKGYGAEAGIVIGLLLAIGAFIAVAVALIKRFMDVKDGRADWSGLGGLAVMGGALILVVVFLLNQAATIIT